jgi:cell division initiation protein
MELTPKVFRDVQFREKLRGGYHPEDVDEFLEQSAVGVEELTERLRQATERAQRAEQAAAEASVTDESLKRVLLMAQRTADQAVREAREEADGALRQAHEEADKSLREAHEEADKALREAHEEADRTLAEAKAKAHALVDDAEEHARRAYEGAVVESRATMEQAETSLSQVRQDVEALRGWVDLHKSHLLAVLSEAQALVENAGLLSEPPPVTSSTEAAEAAAPDPQPAEVEDEVTGEHFGLDAEPAAEDVIRTSDWDPRYLEDRGGGPSDTRPTPVRPGANQEALALAGERIGEATGAGSGEGESGPALAPPDVATIALDERALDSFFNERDLGDERGPSRFRRRP